MSDAKQTPLITSYKPSSSGETAHTDTYSTPKPSPAAAIASSTSETIDEEQKMALLRASQRYNDTRAQTIDVTGTKNHHFEDYGLKRNLLIGIYSMGFEKPSPVQEDAIPIALTKSHLLARAKNGTGKTAAFLIPVLEKIDESKPYIQAVVLIPTRELAIQTYQTAQEMSKHMHIKIQMIVGGNSVYRDILQLKEPGHLIIATVGRLRDLAERKVCDLSTCTMLVFDEADRLLSEDYQQPVADIIFNCNKDCQLMLFSATFPQSVKEFSDRFMPGARTVNTMDELTLVGLTQYYAYVDERMKVTCLDALFQKLHINQAMIFCNSVPRVVLLAKKITEMSQSCFYVHAQMPQQQRNRVFYDFRNGKGRVLVCSDLLSRGIDIQSVNVVINFDMPKTAETYLHRVGRTGRFGHKGIAINLITNEDKKNMYQIERELKTEILPIPAEIDSELYPID